MRSSTSDEDSGRLWVKLANALDNRDPFDDRPSLTDLICHLLHLRLCHRNVGFVFKVIGLMCFTATRLTAHHASEDSCRAGTCQSYLCKKIIQIYFVFSDGKYGWKVHNRVSSSCSPGR